MKNKLQPTRATFKKFSNVKSKFFHFGTENGEETWKNTLKNYEGFQKIQYLRTEGSAEKVQIAKCTTNQNQIEAVRVNLQGNFKISKLI